ncbi:SDR family NAD(P)-dependent oxidoreductase [Coraliomargarita sp. SDUM461004]|uniref:SDR family NAD(P)-dependent oxidoreductase n=1 Tax=Thalassobacterium sedimentorum TaxID=3041258 RepID=A0ABU1AI11_9BACT|nr:SDR family NAD(P)-dependent oxidoreductase [Coraliomargarita sp. SDUM461004]MDQ8194457.1 SDR family NAD(P)-dependent oxidoreductase [Coraliomargarita sp. SDUM461004]
MHILITGVSSGLGHGLAKTYLAQGAEVYGCSRRAPKDLIQRGLHFASVDLADARAGTPVFEELIRPVPHFDSVFLNAGKLGEIRDMQATPLDDLRETMEINVWSNKWLLDSLFAHSRRLTQVVAISSGASQSGMRGWNGYSVSKAALNMLIKLYAGEQTETHFTALAPGLVDTAMQDYLTNLPDDPRYQPLAILKAAKGTARMPDAESCARQLIQILPQLLELESGSYADIRKL